MFRKWLEKKVSNKKKNKEQEIQAKKEILGLLGTAPKSAQDIKEREMVVTVQVIACGPFLMIQQLASLRPNDKKRERRRKSWDFLTSFQNSTPSLLLYSIR